MCRQPLPWILNIFLLHAPEDICHLSTTLTWNTLKESHLYKYENFETFIIILYNKLSRITNSLQLFCSLCLSVSVSVTHSGQSAILGEILAFVPLCATPRGAWGEGCTEILVCYIWLGGSRRFHTCAMMFINIYKHVYWKMLYCGVIYKKWTYNLFSNEQFIKSIQVLPTCNSVNHA